jgi:[ribosomal protein S5]-alanine N-acetyltransferase
MTSLRGCEYNGAMPPASSLILETARLRLRHLSSADAPFMLELLNDPDFIRNIADRGVRTEDEAERYILEGPAASYEQHGFGLYLVEAKESKARVGICGLLRRDCHPDVEIGFAFLPAARGRSYAFEAGQAVLDLGIRDLQLERVVALTAPDNFASMRVLEKLGFHFDRMVSWMNPARGSRLFVFEPREALSD